MGSQVTHHNSNRRMNQRSRSWCYTLNNYTEADESKLQALQQPSYHLYGREVGEQGTPHLQGFLYFQNKKSFKQIKKLLGDKAHIEIARGSTKQNVEYCSKEGNLWSRGTPPKGAGKTSDRVEKNHLLRTKSVDQLVRDGDISILTVPTLVKARRLLELETTPLSRMHCCGVWIYGPPGTGKTHYSRESFGPPTSVFMKSQSKWFDGYNGEDIILLDDLDTGVLGHYLKRWMDKWPCYGEIKGGTVALRHNLFVVTSNYTPEMLWPEDPAMAAAVSRRCIFKHMNKRKVD